MYYVAIGITLIVRFDETRVQINRGKHSPDKSRILEKTEKSAFPTLCPLICLCIFLSLSISSFYFIGHLTKREIDDKQLVWHFTSDVKFILSLGKNVAQARHG